MSETTANPMARRTSWSPSPRPDWVQKLNDEGTHLDIAGIVPLTEKSLLAAARRNTGLTNFGADDWVEPFRIFLKSLEEDSRLNLTGRLLTRSDILIYLEARLRVEEEYRLHPDIADQKIEKPILIMGQGRTGTSALQNLLAADPANGTIRTWEALFPAPAPEAATYETDPRIKKADALITQWYRVTPELEAMHEFGGNLPTEGIHLQCSSFQSPVWMNFMGQVPSFIAYMQGRGLLPALEWEKRVLRLLQWKHPRANWVLKTPVYIYMMPEVLKAYPDACFVWTHRDPVKALASAINMVGTLFWQRSDHPFISGVLDASVDETIVAASLNQAVDWIEQGIVPPERLCNVHYEDFVRDPLAVARTIYDKFQIPLTPAGESAMRAYAAENAREKRAPHQYTANANSWAGQARQAYRRYQDYFSVPDEI
jgi:hypothetical protein